jgi:hypothetical protein
MNCIATSLPAWLALAAVLSATAPTATSAGLELKSAAFTTGVGTASNPAFTLTLHGPAAITSATANGRFTLHGSFPGIQLVQTPGAPRLAIRATVTGFHLQWSAAFAGFRLQTTTSLTDPHWTDVSAPAAEVSGTMSVEILQPPGAPAAPMIFFRLVRP